jgi:hypothetical protein
VNPESARRKPYLVWGSRDRKIYNIMIMTQRTPRIGMPGRFFLTVTINTACPRTIEYRLSPPSDDSCRHHANNILLRVFILLTTQESLTNTHVYLFSNQDRSQTGAHQMGHWKHSIQSVRPKHLILRYRRYPPSRACLTNQSSCSCWYCCPSGAILVRGLFPIPLSGVLRDVGRRDEERR